MKPHKPVSTTTLFRWGVNVLKEAMDVPIFGSHFTRSAVTSKCKGAGLSLKEISKSAGWCGKRKLGLFYQKTIEENFSDYVFRSVQINLIDEVYK